MNTNRSVSPGTTAPVVYGLLAEQSGVKLPLQVCRSAAGFYLGTMEESGMPYSRESIEYFPTQDAAVTALNSGHWTQKPNP
jgi:hypothetical protein